MGNASRWLNRFFAPDANVVSELARIILVSSLIAFANRIHPKARSESCLLHVSFPALMSMMAELSKAPILSI